MLTFAEVVEATGGVAHGQPPRSLSRIVVDSRAVRELVARGIIEYSEVIQPLFIPFRNGGTVSSTVAVQMTRVRPISIKTDPSA